MPDKTDYTRKYAQLDVLINLLEGENKRLREMIVRCKECKWWTKQENSLQGRCALMGMYPTGEWYCGNARREVTT